jgi:integrase
MRDPIASLTVQNLTAHELALFRDRRIKDGIRTCQYDLVLIRHILEIARKEWGLGLAVNPVDQIRKPNGLKPRNRRLEETEYRRLEEALGQTRVPYVWPLINLAIETAMRRGELLSLQWDWIDKTLRLAHLPDTKNGHPRSVPLSPSAMYWLDQMPVVGQMVFPVTPVAVRQAWDRLVKRAGITNLHFHDLRHEAISRFFELGLSIPEVALISGHRDPRMLFRYTHLRAEDVAKKLNINNKRSK